MNNLSIYCRTTALFGLLYVFVLPSLSSFGQSEYDYDYGNGYGYSSPVVSVLDSATSNEENRHLGFVVLLSEPQNHPVSCDTAAEIAFGDKVLEYPNAPPHVTFQPGVIEQVVQVNIELGAYDTTILDTQSIAIAFGTTQCVGASLNTEYQFGVGIVSSR